VSPSRHPLLHGNGARLALGIAAAVLVLAAAHRQRFHAVAIGTASLRAGLNQVATATADPRPNLVAASGQWLRKGRNGSASIPSWRCVFGDGSEQGFHACVANDGASPSGPFAVVAEDAPTIALLITGGLAPGETLCAPVEVAPGVALVVDAAGAVDEAREDDNRLAPVPVPTLQPVALPTCVPRPTPLAELSGVGWAGFIDTQGFGCWPTHLPTIVLDGARVANDGELAAGPFRVGPPDWQIPDLPADAVRSIRDARLGGTFSMSIDPDNAVAEHDEANNTIFFVHATAPPTCTPRPTTPGPGSATPTSTATATAEVAPSHLVHVPAAVKAFGLGGP